MITLLSAISFLFFIIFFLIIIIDSKKEFLAEEENQAIYNASIIFAIISAILSVFTII